MRHSVLAIAAIFATLTQASAQTPTEMLEHIDDLGRTNEKLQERVKSLENDNKALRERLKQLGAGEPSPASVAPQPVPTTAAPRIGAQGPASRTLPLPSPVGIAAVSHNGTIDLDSHPQGAQAATSLGSGCETPCAMEISAAANPAVTDHPPRSTSGFSPASRACRTRSSRRTRCSSSLRRKPGRSRQHRARKSLVRRGECGRSGIFAARKYPAPRQLFMKMRSVCRPARLSQRIFRRGR